MEITPPGFLLFFSGTVIWQTFCLLKHQDQNQDCLVQTQSLTYIKHCFHSSSNLCRSFLTPVPGSSAEPSVSPGTTWGSCHCCRRDWNLNAIECQCHNVPVLQLFPLTKKKLKNPTKKQGNLVGKVLSSSGYQGDTG